MTEEITELGGQLVSSTDQQAAKAKDAYDNGTQQKEIGRDKIEKLTTGNISSNSVTMSNDEIVYPNGDRTEFAAHLRYSSRERDLASDRKFGRPKFANPLVDNLNVKLRARVELKSRLEPRDDPSMRIEWFKGDLKIESENRFSIYFNHGYAALIISGFEAIDNGIYKCVATNQSGSDQVEARVELDQGYEEEKRERAMREEKLRQILRIKEVMRLADKMDAKKKVEYAAKRKDIMENEKLIGFRQRYMGQNNLITRGGSEPPIGLNATGGAFGGDNSHRSATREAEDVYGFADLEHDDYFIRIPYQTIEDSSILRQEKEILETTIEFEDDMAKDRAKSNQINHSKVSNGDSKSQQIDVSAQQDSFLINRPYQEIEDSQILKREKLIKETVTEFEPNQSQESKAIDLGQHASGLIDAAQAKSNVERLAISGTISPEAEQNVSIPYREIEDSALLMSEKIILETVTEFQDQSEELVASIESKGDKLMKLTNTEQYKTIPYRELEDLASIRRDREIYETVTEFVEPQRRDPKRLASDPKRQHNDLIVSKSTEGLILGDQRDNVTIETDPIDELEKRSSKNETLRDGKDGVDTKFSGDSQDRDKLVKVLYRESQDSNIFMRNKTTIETTTEYEPEPEALDKSIKQEINQEKGLAQVRMKESIKMRRIRGGDLNHGEKYDKNKNEGTEKLRMVTNLDDNRLSSSQGEFEALHAERIAFNKSMHDTDDTGKNVEKNKEDNDSDEFEEDSFIYTDVKISESPILDKEIYQDMNRMSQTKDKNENRRLIIPSWRTQIDHIGGK